MQLALTFDFWDTLFVDDSDEQRRSAEGLVPKPQARRELFVDEVLAHHPGLRRAAVVAAYQTACEQCRHAWKEHHRTPTLTERLDLGLQGLGLPRTPGFDQLVGAFAEMEVLIPPHPAPGVAKALALLAERYRLGIISDTIVTPGSGLRRILANANLLHFFEPRALVFSDEIGASKPEPALFLHAARELGVVPGALVHVGDREENDVMGPHQAGCRAILYTGVADRRTDGTRADGVCEHHDRMSSLVTSLEREIVERHDE